MDYEQYLERQAEIHNAIEGYSENDLIDFLSYNYFELLEHLDDEDDNASLEQLKRSGLIVLIKSRREETKTNIINFCVDYNFNEYLFNL